MLPIVVESKTISTGDVPKKGLATDPFGHENYTLEMPKKKRKMDQVEHLLVSYYLKLALRDPDRKTQSSQDEIYKSLLKKG